MSALSAADGTPQSVGDPGSEDPQYVTDLIGATVDQVRTLALSRLLDALALTPVATTAPAAGAEWSQTVPQGMYWEPVFVSLVFTASAAVANRAPNLVYTIGGTRILRVPPVAAIVANAGVQYHYSQIGMEYGAGGVTVGFAMPLPSMLLPPNATVGTFTPALDVGDAYTTPVLTVRQWSVGQVYWAADLLGRELGYEHLNDLPSSTPTPGGTGQPIPVSPLAR